MTSASDTGGQTTDSFCFCIGPDAIEHHVHGPAFAALSGPMNKLINGDFKEAKEKKAFWPEVSPQTFMLLEQFALKNDYVAKAFVKDDADADVQIITVKPRNKSASRKEIPFQMWIPPVRQRAPDLARASMDRAIRFYSQSIPNGAFPHAARSERHQAMLEAQRQIAADEVRALKQSRPDLEGTELKYNQDGERIRGFAKFKEYFDSHTYNHEHPASPLTPPASPDNAAPSAGPITRSRKRGLNQNVPINNTSLSAAPSVTFNDEYAPSHETESSFAQCLTMHTDLYILAQEKLMFPLKTLTLSKIHWILTRFTHDRARLPILVQFAQHVFHNTFGDNDELRALVAEHFALHCKKDNVGGSREFVQLMDDGGDLATAIWKQIFWRKL